MTTHPHHSNRGALIISGLALTIAIGATGAPAVAQRLFADNSHKVDGFHAVGSGASVTTRKGKLVATSGTTGRLPNGIIAKALDANKLDGLDSSVFVNDSGYDAEDSQGTSVVIGEANTFTTIATTTITTDGATSTVLVLGDVTAQNTNGNTADLFARITVDGNPVNPNHWDTMPAGAPVFPRAEIGTAAVVELGPGDHTVEMQAAYWMGGTDQVVRAYARSISAVELGG